MHPILARRGRLGAYLVASLPLAAVLAALLTGAGTFVPGEAIVEAASFHPCASGIHASSTLSARF